MGEEAGHTRRTTRAALVEIPTRLGQLRVSPPPMPILAATVPAPLSPATPRNALTPNNHNTPTTVTSSAFLSPTPSPDELVIQQRGRKRMPVTWSPDINTTKQSPFQPINRTPPKSPLNLFNSTRDGSTLRSSSKKRILLNEFEAKQNGSKLPTPKKLDLYETSPTKTKNQSPGKTSPAPKRMKLDNKPLNIDNNNPLETTLKGLSHDQLIDIIKNMVHKHPELEHEVKAELPMPDLKPFEEKLTYLRLNIYRSLPKSRLTSKTDSPAYSRAATHLTTFKKQLCEQGRTLTESQHWLSVIKYAMFAWSQVRSTPLWDNYPHNSIRRQCFKYLAGLFMSALKRGQFEKAFLLEVHEKMESLVTDSDDIQSCMKFIDVQTRSM